MIGIDATDATRCSAKTGLGVEDVLESLIAKVPPPKGDPAAPLQALIIDSWFDNYVGVVMLVRIVNGTLRPKDKIKMMATGAQSGRAHRRVHAEVAQPRIAVGGAGGLHHRGHQGTDGREGRRYRHPRVQGRHRAAAGLQGSEAAGVRGLYPVEANQYDALRESLEKLKLNDASLQYEPEVSQALGFGFRCASSGCCTWKSCRSGSSASSTWISSRPHRRLRGRAERRIDDQGREPGEDAGWPYRRSPRADRHREPVHAAGLRGITL